MTTALVTGAPGRVSDIAIALKSAGYDILAAGPTAAEDVDLEVNPVDVVVVVTEGSAPVTRPRPEPLPWWRYATVDPDLGFADWRDSVLCLLSEGGTAAR